MALPGGGLEAEFRKLEEPGPGEKNTGDEQEHQSSDEQRRSQKRDHDAPDPEVREKIDHRQDDAEGHPAPPAEPEQAFRVSLPAPSGQALEPDFELMFLEISRRFSTKEIALQRIKCSA